MSSSAAAPQSGSMQAALACLIVVGTLLGLSINIAKLAVSHDLSPIAVLFWAALGSGIALQLFAISKRQTPRLRWRTAEYALASGTLFAVPNMVALLAIGHVGAGVISFTFAFPVLFTYLLALTLRQEKFNGARALGVLFGLAGAALLALPKAVGSDPLILWFAVAMTAPAIIAVGNIYRTMRWPAGETALSLAPLMLIGGAVATLGIMLAAGQGYALIDIPTLSALLLVLAQTAVFTVLYALYFVLQRLGGPVYLSQIGSVAGLVGVSIAIVFLGEAPPPNLFIVAALIGAGVVLVSQINIKWLPFPRPKRVHGQPRGHLVGG
ncbi:MAG: DMT family transporter [Pseudomonadota bacterium]